MRKYRFPSLLAAASLAMFAGLSSAHDVALHARAVGEPAAAEASASLTGSIREIVIDDPARGTSQRYVELELDDGSLVPLRGRAADGLVKGARFEVAGRREGKSLEVGTVRSLANGRRADPKALIEIDGTLTILHADYFAEERSAFIYEVQDASGNVRRLRMGTLPGPLAPGMKVRVQGRVEPDQESISPDRITIIARPSTSSDEDKGSGIAKAASTRSVLVIMANFNNTALPALSAAQAQQVMTSNSDSVANFFRETSYGQQILNVTTTPGWVTMNMAQPATCDWRTIGSSAEAAARSLGAAYDPTTYGFVVYVFPAVPSCGWIGLAYINSPKKAWVNGTSAFRTSTIAHEMGHNYGLLHAASLRCTGAAIGGSCSSSEYGDPFDAMGNQRPMHYNAMQKSKLGWIPAASVLTHTGGSATYTLAPIENAGASTYAVKIPTGSSTRTYWLEFRQPIGFDSPLASFPNNGAQIRVATPFETQCAGCDAYSDDTQILDMTPGTSTFTDATLVAGQTFSDPNYGINVTVLSASASAMTVQVGTGGAPPPAPGPGATTTSVSSTPNPAVAGAVATVTATVAGNAPTGSVSFTDNGTTISGCAAAVVSGSGNSRSASCTTNAFIAGSHAIVATYSGDASNVGSTSATYTQVVNAPVNGTNVALAANGGVATASSTHSEGFNVIGVNDGRRSGSGWGNYAGWNDGTMNTFPDSVQIAFNGTKTIDHVVVFSVQDDYLNPVEPTDAMAFTLYGLTAFDVQGWNGTAWITLASVTGNTRVKRVVSFTPFATSRIRVVIAASADGVWSRMTELEAWTSTASPSQTNVALASNGSLALASSTHSAGFAVNGVIDGKRSGYPWGSFGGWNDGTSFTFPDWVEIRFAGRKVIDHVVVSSVQDNFLNPVEPIDSTVCTLYGIRDFEVQSWNGTSWTAIATVTGNRLAKRAVWFDPVATDRIRINVTGTQDGVWSRITEVEAWGN